MIPKPQQLFQQFYEVWKKLSKREQLIFYVAVAMIILATLMRGIIYPILFKITSLDKAIHEKNKKFRHVYLIFAHEERIGEEKKLYGKYTPLESNEDEETLGILKELGALAKKTAVYLQDVKPAGTLMEGAFKKYMVNLSFEAQMDQLVNFIYAIEGSEKLLRVERLNIIPKSTGSSVASCKMTVFKMVIP